MWHHTDDGTAWLAMAGMMTLMSVLTAVVVVTIVKAARNGGRTAPFSSWTSGTPFRARQR